MIAARLKTQMGRQRRDLGIMVMDGETSGRGQLVRCIEEGFQLPRSKDETCESVPFCSLENEKGVRSQKKLETIDEFELEQRSSIVGGSRSKWRKTSQRYGEATRQKMSSDILIAARE